MDTVLAPLYFLVSWIMIGWHWLFSELLGVSHDGIAWLLSIIGLVIVIRTLLIPLFVRQIRSQRKMQLLQPKVRELQKRYKGDRQRLQQETMKLYQDAGTNPFASCFPILLQAPFFFALFRVLDGISKGHPRGAFAYESNKHLFESVQSARIAGVDLSDSFLGTDDMRTKIVAVVMIILMVSSQYITQLQIMRKNMPKEALEGPMAQQQKILLYVLPLVFVFSGVYFPLGTVVYWLTSNLWTMGQQLYVIRRMPAPGTEAERRHKERLEAKARKKGELVPDAGTDTTSSGSDGSDTSADAGGTAAARQQPKRTTRAQRKGKK